ncbi:hypothetical protein IFM89_029444 [Coptis chinensis]|uniref:Uncharacterized protein n=1 Tax=Coptis chinensis TaxID=261450 RepID=A0A835H9Z2_9MAGN|nr:hypothetical protein IFM89_029444 [Coptis chinensis]
MRLLLMKLAYLNSLSLIIPKIESSSGETSFPATRKDFVLYVGGHVWALDWCGSVYQQSDSHIKFAAHPPETSSESSYHKIGMPLTGRGVVQIWCLLHEVKEEVLPPIPKKQCGRPRMQVRKVEPLGTLEAENQDQALSVQLDDAKAKKICFH